MEETIDEICDAIYTKAAALRQEKKQEEDVELERLRTILAAYEDKLRAEIRGWLWRRREDGLIAETWSLSIEVEDRSVEESVVHVRQAAVSEFLDRVAKCMEGKHNKIVLTEPRIRPLRQESRGIEIIFRIELIPKIGYVVLKTSE